MGHSNSKNEKRLSEAVESSNLDMLMHLLRSNAADRLALNSTRTSFSLPTDYAIYGGRKFSPDFDGATKDCNLLNALILSIAHPPLRTDKEEIRSLISEAALTLCECGIDKNAVHDFGMTPLHQACDLFHFCSGDVYKLRLFAEVVKIMLDHKKIAKEHQEKRKLSVSMFPNLEPELQKLADTPVDINKKTQNHIQETALHVICRASKDYHKKWVDNPQANSPHHEVLIELLANGADVAATDFLGRTALHYACLSVCTYPSVVAELLTAIASSPKAESILNATDRYGFTALHYAGFFIQKEKVALLLAQPLIDWSLPVGAVRTAGTNEIDKDALEEFHANFTDAQNNKKSTFQERDYEKRLHAIEPFLHLQLIFCCGAEVYAHCIGKPAGDLGSVFAKNRSYIREGTHEGFIYLLGDHILSTASLKDYKTFDNTVKEVHEMIESKK